MSNLSAHFFDGKISGAGIEAGCLIQAIKRAKPGFPDVHYRYEVKSVTADFPDGLYTLTVNDQISPVRRFNGQWIAVDF